jgi:hypothetical protein
MSKLVMPKVIWFKTVKGRSGKELQRIEATLVCAGEEYCTVEVDGERFSARTEDVKLAKGAGQ